MSETASFDDARWLRERDQVKRVTRHTLMECMIAMSQNGSKRGGPLAKTVRGDQSRKDGCAGTRANGSCDQPVGGASPTLWLATRGAGSCAMQRGGFVTR